MRNKWWFYTTILALVAYRLLHFGPQLDLPHDWRQADTAYYIQNFYENGIDLLQPEVCWMGGHGELALECPIPEAIVVLAQYVLGTNMWVSRGCFLLFFLLAAYYFFGVVKRLLGSEIAEWSTVVYMALPLGLFYSRAIHIDFFALAVVHASIYYLLMGLHMARTLPLLASALLATVAAVVKIPYLFYWALPVLAYTVRQKQLEWLLTRSAVYIIPLSVFYLWQQHAYGINSAAPDWDYLLHYRKFDDNAHWYFGSVAQRLSLYNWKVIGWRLVTEVGAGLGVLIGLYGLYHWRKPTGIYLLVWWMIGLAIYLLTFFNLNLFHNYYQLPFLALAASMIGIGLLMLQQRQEWLATVALVALIGVSIAYAECSYYDIPEELDNMAKHIKHNLPDNALPIVTYQSFDCRNPRLLYRAGQKGWSIPIAGATMEVIERLKVEEGATHWIVVAPEPPSNSPALPSKKIKIDGQDEVVYIYELK